MAQDWKDMLAALAPRSADAPDNTYDEGDSQAEIASAATDRANSGPLRIIIDRKGRKGKVATIIEGFTLDDEEVDALASELKRKIGTGGSARGGEILLQGDWKDKAATLLREKGFKVK